LCCARQVRAIEAFTPAQEHVGRMLLRGEVAEFVELMLGGPVAEALGDLTRGLQDTLGGAARALFERAVDRLGILQEDRDHLVSLLECWCRGSPRSSSTGCGRGATSWPRCGSWRRARPTQRGGCQ